MQVPSSALTPQAMDPDESTLSEIEGITPGWDGHFGPGSMLWKVLRDRLYFVGGTRALLLQISHPLVAAAVANHSEFMKSPIPRAQRTFWVLKQVVFGTRSQAAEALEHVKHKHAKVDDADGTVQDSSSCWRGQPYSTKVGEARMWIVACLADTIYVVHDLLFEPLQPADKERLWQEWRHFSKIFRVPDEEIPLTYEDFRTWFEARLAGGTNPSGLPLVELRTDTFRELSTALFAPWQSVALSIGVITWGIVPAQLQPAVRVRPEVLHRVRFAVVRFLLRLVARSGILAVRHEPAYLDALERADPKADPLDAWDRARL